MLTNSDWVEIYSAVESKRRSVVATNYGDDRASQRRWIKQLDSIIETIGSDGENMYSDTHHEDAQQPVFVPIDFSASEGVTKMEKELLSAGRLIEEINQ